MDEIYEPKKGFEDLFLALLKEYKREIFTGPHIVNSRTPRDCSQYQLNFISFKHSTLSGFGQVPSFLTTLGCS